MITLKLILSFTFHLDYKENVVQQGVGLLLEKDEQGDVCQDAEGAVGRRSNDSRSVDFSWHAQ